MASDRLNRATVSWAMYDWANSAFATTILAGFFPVFFKEYWYADVEATRSTFVLGIGNSVAGLVVAIFAPILGSIADRGRSKRKFLLTLAGTGMALTGAFYFIGEGQWFLAIVNFGVALFCFMSANTFYDSLIVAVADAKTKEFVSALGYSLGYLGGGILLAVNVAMTLQPEWFGIPDASQAVKLSFVSVALWWAVFTIPLVLFVKEPEVRGAVPGGRAVSAGLRQLVDTIGDLRHLKVLVLFLVAYWLYIDGVHTIVRMAVDYGISLGFESSNLITALLITQFVGFPATIAVGKLGERIGPKNGIFLCIAVYCIVTVWGYFMTEPIHFYALAATIGLAQGGAQALSRSFYVSLIPTNRAAQFFGFYNMLGKFGMVLGPALVAGVVWLTESNRLSILSLLVLFGSGVLLLYFVDEQKGHSDAEAFQERHEPIQ